MRKDFKLLSIIIPSYNSEKNIRELLRRIKRVKIQGVKKEIIVVNDSSKDKTDEILRKTKGIIYVKHQKNTGKGGAVRTGLIRASGDILLIQDDDLEYDPLEIPKLLKPILKGQASVVFGSRHISKKNPHSSLAYYLGGFAIDKIISLMLGANMTDAITGAKVFTREVYNKIKPIESNGFEIEVELAAKSVRNNFKPKEVAITYNPRKHSEGKNIRWYHAYPILKSLVKYYFVK